MAGSANPSAAALLTSQLAPILVRALSELGLQMEREEELQAAHERLMQANPLITPRSIRRTRLSVGTHPAVAHLVLLSCVQACARAARLVGVVPAASQPAVRQGDGVSERAAQLNDAHTEAVSACACAALTCCRGLFAVQHRAVRRPLALHRLPARGRRTGAAVTDCVIPGRAISFVHTAQRVLDCRVGQRCVASSSPSMPTAHPSSIFRATHPH